MATTLRGIFALMSLVLFPALSVSEPLTQLPPRDLWGDRGFPPFLVGFDHNRVSRRIDMAGHEPGDSLSGIMIGMKPASYDVAEYQFAIPRPPITGSGLDRLYAGYERRMRGFRAGVYLGEFGHRIADDASSQGSYYKDERSEKHEAKARGALWIVAEERPMFQGVSIDVTGMYGSHELFRSTESVNRGESEEKRLLDLRKYARVAAVSTWGHSFSHSLRFASTGTFGTFRQEESPLGDDDIIERKSLDVQLGIFPRKDRVTDLFANIGGFYRTDETLDDFERVQSNRTVKDVYFELGAYTKFHLRDIMCRVAVMGFAAHGRDQYFYTDLDQGGDDIPMKYDRVFLECPVFASWKPREWIELFATWKPSYIYKRQYKWGNSGGEELKSVIARPFVSLPLLGFVLAPSPRVKLALVPSFKDEIYLTSFELMVGL